MSRAPYARENMRLEVCLLGMQGCGKPGRHMFTTIEWGLFGNYEPAGVDFRQDYPVPRHMIYPNLVPANRGFAVVGEELPKQIISKVMIGEALIIRPLHGTAPRFADS